MTQIEDQRSKDEAEKNKIKAMMTEAERKALEIIEDKYPKHIAAEFVVELRVGWQLPDDTLFESAKINKVTVRRQNRAERRTSTSKVITSAGKYNNMDIAQDKLLTLVVKIEAEDGNTWLWSDVPTKLRADILNNMDILDEDEILEAMSALEYGYGNFKDFYASQAFRTLKEQEEQSFRGDEEEI